jgi:hypothetical protein
MIIEVDFYNTVKDYYDNIKNYDFYPETRMLFAEGSDGESFYIPITENVKSVAIKGAGECGYLEGHDEAC